MPLRRERMPKWIIEVIVEAVVIVAKAIADNWEK